MAADAVAGAEREMAEIAEQLAPALMQEQQLVAVAVAGEVVHDAAGPPQPQADMGVVQNLRRIPRRRLRLVEPGEVEGPRPQRPFERHPAGRGMAMIEVGGGAEEPLLADLALVGAGRQGGVSLARGDALDSREG